MCCCLYLFRLCSQAEGLQRLFACGGAEVLTELIKNNMDDAVMVNQALLLLGTLCTLDEATAMKIYSSVAPLDLLMSCTTSLSACTNTHSSAAATSPLGCVVSICDVQ